MGISSSSICESSTNYSRVFESKFPAFIVNKMQRMNKQTISSEFNRSKRNSDDKDRYNSMITNHPVSCISQIPTKGILKLQNLKRKVSKFKRKMNNNNLDYSKLFYEFISTWSYKELQALKHEYEALDIIYEIIKQSNNSRPSVNTLMQDFDVLFKTGLCADTEISYRGELFHVHRSILSIRSTFFRQCFYSWEAQPDIMLSSYNNNNNNSNNPLISSSSSSSSSPQNNCDICNKQQTVINNTSSTTSTTTNTTTVQQKRIIPIHLDNPSITPDIFRNILQYIYTEQLMDFDEDQIDNWEMIYLLREKFHLPNRLQLDMKRLFENSATDSISDCLLIFSQSNDCAIELDFLPFDRKTLSRNGNLIHFNRHYHYSLTNNHSGSLSEPIVTEDDFDNSGVCIGYDNSYNPNNTYELLCHKAILAARSTFFRKIIEMKESAINSNNNTTNAPMKIVLEESIISYRYARVLLNCLYTGQLNMQLIVTRHNNFNLDNRSPTLDLTASLHNCSAGVGGGGGLDSGDIFSSTGGLYIHSFIPHCLECIYDVMQLYQIGTYLDFKTLCHACEDLLINNINLDNCINILRWSSHSYGSALIRRHVISWMREEFSIFFSSKYFVELSKKELIELVSSQFTQASEAELLHAIYRWAEMKVEKFNSSSSTTATASSSLAASTPNVNTDNNHGHNKETKESSSNSFVYLLKDIYSKRPQSKLKYQNDSKIALLVADIIPFINFSHIFTGTESFFNSLIRRGIIPAGTLSNLSKINEDVKQNWCRMINSQEVRSSEMFLYKQHHQEQYNLMSLLDLPSVDLNGSTKFRGPRYVSAFYEQVKLVLAERNRSLTAKSIKSPLYQDSNIMSTSSGADMESLRAAPPGRMQPILLQPSQSHFPLISGSITPMIFKPNRRSVNLSMSTSMNTSSSFSATPPLNQRLLQAIWKRAKDLQSGVLIQRALFKPCVSWATVFQLLRLQTVREFGLPDNMVDEIFSNDKIIQDNNANNEQNNASIRVVTPRSSAHGSSMLDMPNTMMENNNNKQEETYNTTHGHNVGSYLNQGSQTARISRRGGSGASQNLKHRYSTIGSSHGTIHGWNSRSTRQLNYSYHSSTMKLADMTDTNNLDRSQTCLTTNKICQCGTNVSNYYTNNKVHSNMTLSTNGTNSLQRTSKYNRASAILTSNDNTTTNTSNHNHHHYHNPHYLTRKSYPTSPSVLLLPSTLDYTTIYYRDLYNIQQHHQQLYQNSEQHQALYQSHATILNDNGATCSLTPAPNNTLDSRHHKQQQHHHHQQQQQLLPIQNNRYQLANNNNTIARPVANSTICVDYDDYDRASFLTRSRRFSLKLNRNNLSNIFNVTNDGYTTLPNRHNSYHHRKTENPKRSNDIEVTTTTSEFNEEVSPSSYNPWVFNGFNFKTPPPNSSKLDCSTNSSNLMLLPPTNCSNQAVDDDDDDDDNDDDGHEGDRDDDNDDHVDDNDRKRLLDQTKAKSTAQDDDHNNNNTKNNQLEPLSLTTADSLVLSSGTYHQHHHHHRKSQSTHSPIYGVRKHSSQHKPRPASVSTAETSTSRSSHHNHHQSSRHHHHSTTNTAVTAATNTNINLSSTRHRHSSSTKSAHSHRHQTTAPLVPTASSSSSNSRHHNQSSTKSSMATTQIATPPPLTTTTTTSSSSSSSILKTQSSSPLMCLACTSQYTSYSSSHLHHQHHQNTRQHHHHHHHHHHEDTTTTTSSSRATSLSDNSSSREVEL